jgi:hypothetical protein
MNWFSRFLDWLSPSRVIVRNIRARGGHVVYLSGDLNAGKEALRGLVLKAEVCERASCAVGHAATEECDLCRGVCVGGFEPAPDAVLLPS